MFGDPERPVEVRPDADGEYKVGVSPVWRLGKKMLGAIVPMRFHAGEPFHAGAAWQLVDVGLRGMKPSSPTERPRRGSPDRKRRYAARVGQEARCTARLGESVFAGTALLETDSLVFRGEVRLEIPLADVRSVEARDGTLTIAHSKGWAAFELGPRAERWAERIRNPRTLADKLGLRPGARVGLVGADTELEELVRQRTALVTAGEPDDGSDLVFLRVDDPADLERIPVLRHRVAPAGALWVIAPKGGREPVEARVLAAGRAAGLVDTKVVRYSSTHTAHRFSVPTSRR